MSERPPGWYPDASVPGYERWWDGGTWSHVTRPGRSAAAAAERELAATREAARRAAEEAGTGSLPAPPWQEPGRTGTGPGTPPGYGGYPYAPPGLPQTTPDGVPLARAGQRLLARFLDSLITSAIGMALTWPQVTRMIDAYRDWLRTVDAAYRGPGPRPSFTELFNQLNDGPFAEASSTVLSVTLLVAVVYQVMFVALRGATPGKAAAGIRVRPWATEERPGWARAVQRVLGFEIVGLVPFVGGLYGLLDALSLLWDPKRQCFHDKWPGTVVVRGRR